MSPAVEKLFPWPPADSSLPVVLAAPEREEWCREAHDFLVGLGNPWNRSIVFATSGSSGGEPKGVVFFPEALEASARSVNEWLGADVGGDWCCPLPDYHVGGFMVYLRAALAGSRAYEMEGKWNAARYASLIEEKKVAWSSLVPAQVVDIVNHKIAASSSLKTVVVGGGALIPEIGEEARALGWPVVQSYGMTESASQLATARLDEPYTGKDIPVLPHWDLQLDETGRIRIRGVARFSAYLRKTERGWALEEIDSGEYWTSQDVVRMEGGRITFLRRADRQVKILGELVDLDDWENEFAQFLPGALLCPLPDERRGVLVYACHPDGEALRGAVAKWNEQTQGLKRLAAACVMEIPRNNMGKIARKSLETLCSKWVSANLRDEEA